MRVEPNGDAVVAGRGAPNTVVEMLVDGKPVARALADPSGQFAIVPPALPTGASEIQLRTRGADGRESRSGQTVAVSVAEGRDRAPLVALTAPDRPTVVLSQPDAPTAGLAQGTGPSGKEGVGKEGVGNEGAGRPADAKVAARRGADGAKAEAPAGAAARPGAPRPARIVSVDAQAGGRLFVTGAGAPGASVRLYLNDTLVAPGAVGPDGTVTFTIGRGVEPGRYQVRIDQVDAGTGTVRGRAEVAFTMPPSEPARAAARGPSTPEAPAGDPSPREPQRADGRMADSGRHAAGATGAEVGPAAAPKAGSAAGAAPAGTPAQGGAVFVPEIGTARISRGDNLWRISQRAYGRGERYTVIYDANQDQIRDPNLIYPGQIFVLPGAARG